MSNMLSSVTKFLSGGATAAGGGIEMPNGATNNFEDTNNLIGGSDSYAPPSHTSSSMHGSFTKCPPELDATLLQPTTTTK